MSIGSEAPSLPFATAANIDSVRWPPACPFGHVPGASLSLIGRRSSYFEEQRGQ